MPVSVEQLAKVKGDLIRFLDADSELPEISDQGKQAVVELGQLDSTGSNVLDQLAAEDAELAVIARAVADKVREIKADQLDLGHRITQAGHAPLLLVDSGRMIVRLRLVGEDETFDLAQDLEDTLWLGMVIVQAVQESMESMRETLSLATARENLGEQLADRIERLEGVVSEIGRLRDEIEHQSERLR